MSVMNFEVQKRIEHRSPKSSRKSPRSPLKVWRALTAWRVDDKWDIRELFSARLVSFCHISLTQESLKNSYGVKYFINRQTVSMTAVKALKWVNMFHVHHQRCQVTGGLYLSKGIPFSTGSLHRDQELANHILYIRNLPPITSTRFQLTKRVDAIGQFVS